MQMLLESARDNSKRRMIKKKTYLQRTFHTLHDLNEILVTFSLSTSIAFNSIA